jgi:hypothetical protein
MNEQQKAETAVQPQQYAIIVQGHLDPVRWADWFAGLTLTLLESGDTLLAGQVADQAALHGILNRIRDLNLTLLTVNVVDEKSPAACALADEAEKRHGE